MTDFVFVLIVTAIVTFAVVASILVIARKETREARVMRPPRTQVNDLVAHGDRKAS
jgi:hypothetical protein